MPNDRSITKSTLSSLGGRIARGRDRDEDVTPLVTEVVTLRIERAIQRHLEGAPPLSDEQKARITALVLAP